jgi:cytochrome c oxidase subunit 2
MFRDFPLFPQQGSTMAAEVDALFLFLVAMSLFFSVLIAAAVIYFSVRYRRRSEDEMPQAIHGSLPLEITWTAIPFVIVVFIFVWSAKIFVDMYRVPAGSMEVYVVGKRWMWKAQHMSGQREINELHVPVGTAVKVLLTSEDVIHSFYVPAFRVKKDALPGRYSTLWFEASEPGTYRLYCAEYCGTKHSEMKGQIVVMEKDAFQAWLSGGTGGSMAEEGKKLFEAMACQTCHQPNAQGRGPRLEGAFGSQVKLAGGGTVTVDAEYVRESIVHPSAKVVEGYQPIMPTYQGLISEEGISQLVAYIQTLKGPGGAEAPLPAGPGAAAPAAPQGPTTAPQGGAQ